MTERKQPVYWRGAIAFVLALGLSLSMVLMIVAAMLRTNPLGEAAASVFSTIFGAAIGALATYLGQSGGAESVREEEDDEEQT